MARRVLQDRYFKQAKAEGYAARSAYKLIEIDDGARILRRGYRVLDVGCAPGSWLQVAAERVGPKGRVVGVDLSAVRAPMPEHVRTFKADALTIDPAVLLEAAGGVFDAVISDMAPSTSGAGDAERSISMCHDLLAMLPPLLRPGGLLVFKVFEGSGYPDLLGRCRSMFQTVRGTKPKATRDVSREIFVVGIGYRAPRVDPPKAKAAGPMPEPAPGWGAP